MKNQIQKLSGSKDVSRAQSCPIKKGDVHLVSIVPHMYSQVRTLMIIQAIHSPQIIQTYAVTLRARDQELAVCLLALAAVNMATPKHNPQKILAMFMCRLVTTSSLYQGGTRVVTRSTQSIEHPIESRSGSSTPIESRPIDQTLNRIAIELNR